MKVGGKNRLLKTFGYAKTKQEGELFQLPAKTEMRKLQGKFFSKNQFSYNSVRIICFGLPPNKILP
jgi:hypothetical protein